MHRLCRLHNLRVSRKAVRRRRLGTSENGAQRLKAERTRECLALVAARSITSAAVVATLRELFARRGAPRQNAYCESFNGRLRDECLNLEIFTSLAEARTVLADFREDYNERRPHSALGYMTPQEYAHAERARAAPPLRLAPLACP